MAGVPEPVQPEGAEESSDSSEETAVVLALGSDSLLSGAESSVEGEAVSAPPVGMSGAALTDRDPDCEKEEEDKLDDHTQECSTSDTGGSGLFPRASTPCPALPSPPRAPSPSLEEEMGNTLEEEEEEGKSGASSPQPTTAETSASSAVTVPSTLPPELAKKFRILRKIGEGWLKKPCI
ncbi:unnamed protein product [Cyprideis torosa]|uniref:Uncharacterized protein n=1 Tax=Cyprideis torosa TaxID=163714 RepID=A0A7R8ZMS4_9CRUS|nr:unnamed protein product [Cyprideis torosa]CAG0889716.1 unnamed protein product [Cyprideis torosa]